jgi:hypothetical protein
LPATRSAFEDSETSAGYIHVLRIVATTDADATDAYGVGLDRVSTTEDDESIDPGWGASGKGRVVLDEFIPSIS